MNRLFTYIKLLLILLCIFAFISISTIFYTLWRYSPELPSYNSIVNYKPNLSSRIYSSDGLLLKSFFVEERIFIPTIVAGIGITMFFCFMFSWVELLLAKTLTAVAAKPIAATMTRTVSTSGYELGLLAAAGSLTIVPGAIVIYFVRNYIAKGFALGRV